MQEQEQKVREYHLDISAPHTGQTAESDSEADQSEALFNAVNRSDWQTVRSLLERYTQQSEYDPDIACLVGSRRRQVENSQTRIRNPVATSS